MIKNILIEMKIKNLKSKHQNKVETKPEISINQLTNMKPNLFNSCLQILLSKNLIIRIPLTLEKEKDCQNNWRIIMKIKLKLDLKHQIKSIWTFKGNNHMMLTIKGRMWHSMNSLSRQPNIRQIYKEKGWT